MVTFPKLSSGAVTQYPAPMTSGQPVQVLRFLDGSDQRYLLRASARRRWLVHLNLLNESETQMIEAFFLDRQADFGVFSFPDPFTGTLVANCRFGAPALVTEYVGPDAASTALWVVESNA